MADPFSLLAASLTVADSSKKVVDVCTEYISHAKNAPKEFQTIIEDIHDLTGTIKRLETFSKSKEGRSELDQGFDQWQTPLRRLDEYAKHLVKIVERQDLKIGIFHELGFRARWPITWREVQALLDKIEREKNKLHLATAMDGVGVSRKVYMLVDERLPKDMQIKSPNKHSQVPNRNNIAWRSLPTMPPVERQDTILRQISEYTDWPDLGNDLSTQDYRHQTYRNLCGERTCEEFLNSNAYQRWKNRKIRGPSLLYVSGSAATGKSILCSQVIQDIQKTYSSYRPDVGIAYFYVPATVDAKLGETGLGAIVPTWMFQLGSRCSCVPSGLDPHKVLQEKPPADAPHAQLESWYQQYCECLLQALFPILSNFRRTYIILDGLDFGAGVDDDSLAERRVKEISAIIQSLLEQDFGNVSIAIFSRRGRNLDPIFDLADVSIRLLKAEPLPDTLRGYCRSRVEAKVMPELVTAGFRQPYIWLDDIEAAICGASDGLYLAVDMFIDSIIDAIRDGTPIGDYLTYIRDNSEIMMQRDPEIMKQKTFGPNVPTSEPSYSTVRKEA